MNYIYKLKILICVIVALFATMSFGVQLEMMPKVKEKVMNTSKVGDDLYVYKVTRKAFNKARIEQKVESMRLKGFEPTSEDETDEHILFRNEELGQHLYYDKNKNATRYRNKQIEYLGLSKDDSKAEKKLDKLAAKHLHDILKEEKTKYKLMNKEYEFYAFRGDAVERVGTITYRFVRVLDKRPVLGNTSHVRITLGKDGKVRLFQINNPRIEKWKPLNKKVKSSSLEKCLKKRVNSDKYGKLQNGDKVKVKKTRALKSTESYVCETRSNQRFLVPHISFYTENQIEGQRNVNGRIHISMDGESNVDVDENDVIDLRNERK